MSNKDFTWATGRRKNSVARIRMKPGTGQFEVNGKKLEVYFGREVLQIISKQPLALTETIGKFDIYANCSGGGHSGQAGAIKHGISRALNNFDKEKYRSTLKKNSYLTRDPRKTERKKYGLRGARRGFQFSKR